MRTPLLAILAWLPTTACHHAPQTAPPASVRNFGTSGAEVLTWNRAQKLAAFPRMDSIYDAHLVSHGSRVHELPMGAPLAAFAPSGTRAAMLDSFMVTQETAGLIVLQDGKIRLERYALGLSAIQRWTSFSVAKSVTSTLVGAAIRDGYIKSLAEPITTYIPELRGSAYDGVSLRELLTMTSGVAFNEDYSNPNSDIARFYRSTPPRGVDATVSYMQAMPREAPPGTRFSYKTPETNLVGLVVMRATRKPLADYLSEKIWRPYGMERDATWLVDGIGHEQGGCCIQATLRDFARYGQFILDGARINGRPIVPEDWLAAATTKRADIGREGQGYGFLWWTSDDGTFHARGVFGQLIYIDQTRRLVVAMASAWPVATGLAQSQARLALLGEIARVVDAEAGAR